MLKPVSILFCATLAFAQSPDQVYKITLSEPGAMGLKSDCSPEGYILAEWTNGNLRANGALLDADGSPGPELLLNFNTDLPWTRKYDPGTGTSGTFNGCYGETYPFGSSIGYGGNLFVYLERKAGRWWIRFHWHLMYYLLSGNSVREHYTATSESMPFVAWTGGPVSARVTGKFDIQYYRKEGREIVSSYVSTTGGAGRTFSFKVTIEPLTAQ